MMSRFIVEIEPGTCLAPWDGDPGRTLSRHYAERFKSLRAAEIAIEHVRKWYPSRPFENAKTEEVPQ